MVLRVGRGASGELGGHWLDVSAMGSEAAVAASVASGAAVSVASTAA